MDNETVAVSIVRVNVLGDGFGRGETEALALLIPHVPKKLGLVFIKNA